MWSRASTRRYDTPVLARALPPRLAPRARRDTSVVLLRDAPAGAADAVAAWVYVAPAFANGVCVLVALVSRGRRGRALVAGTASGRSTTTLRGCTGAHPHSGVSTGIRIPSVAESRNAGGGAAPRTWQRGNAMSCQVRGGVGWQRW